MTRVHRAASQGPSDLLAFIAAIERLAEPADRR
jgi:hypothetical protein